MFPFDLFIYCFRFLTLGLGVAIIFYVSWHLAHGDGTVHRSVREYLKLILILVSTNVLLVGYLIYIRWRLTVAVAELSSYDQSVTLGSSLLLAAVVGYVFERLKRTLNQ